jgi:hypothetical protein
VRVNLASTAIRGSWILGLVLTIPFAAHTADEGEIRNYIISINRLYENLDYERALNRVQLARQMPRGTDDEVTLSLYEGIILYEMGKQGPATSIITSALFLRPDAKLPVQVAPKVEQFFESVRKQVKSEVAALLTPREAGSPSNKTEQKQEIVAAATGQGGDRQPSSPPRSEWRSTRSEGRQVDATPTKPVIKAEPTLPVPGSPKIEQKSGEPTTVQPLEKPVCEPMPGRVSSRNVKELQLWRLASIKHSLCVSGKFQGLVAEKWAELKTQMENTTNSDERTHISQEIDKFVHDFLYEKP